jgi:hypothetical protein
VRTNIYNNSPKLSKGLVNVMINKFYAPPEVRAHDPALGSKQLGAKWDHQTERDAPSLRPSSLP